MAPQDILRAARSFLIVAGTRGKIKMGAKYTQAQNKATQKYIKNNYDRLYITVPKGLKEKLKSAGIDSINRYVNELIEKDLNNHETDQERKGNVQEIQCGR